MKESFPTVLPYVDGVLLGVNAISDAYLVIDGYGCHAQRIERFGGNHDLNSTLADWRGFHRVLTTQLESADLALGTVSHVERTVERLSRVRRPGVVFVTPSVVVSVSGPSYRDALSRLGRTCRTPVLEVSGPILESDWLDGYADLLRVMAGAIGGRWAGTNVSKASRQSTDVLVVGNLFSRGEYDELANVEVLRGLLSAIGLRVRSVLLEGSAWRGCRLRGALRGVIGLPYGRAAAGALSKALGVEECGTGLPIGFAGTAGWLRRVAGHFRCQDRAERLIDRSLRTYVPRFSWAASRYLVGKRVALCADPFLAEAMVRFLSEMGMQVKLVVLETRHKAHCANPAFSGVPSAIADPAWTDLRNRLRGLAARGEIDLVIGNTQKRGMAPGVPFMEMGIPSYQHHVFVPSPYFGFEGAAGLLQRIVNLLQSP